MTSVIESQRRRLLRHGFIFLFLGVWLGIATATLPHPRAHQRRFVLQPLSEIAPNLVLPRQTKSAVHLLSELPPDPSMRMFESSKS